MWRRKAIRRLELLKAEAALEAKAIKTSGGSIGFLFSYDRYLNELQSADSDRVADAGRRFRRRPVQLSAVAAMNDMAEFKGKMASLPDFEENMPTRLESVARTAYACSAGHYEDDGRSHIPESSPEATARRQRALDNWDRLLKTKPENLAALALFGKEFRDSPPPMTTMDYVKGIGSLSYLAILAVVAYYIWTHHS